MRSLRGRRFAAATGLALLFALASPAAAETGLPDGPTVGPDSPLCKPRSEAPEPGAITLHSATTYPDTEGRMIDLTLDVPALNRSVHANVLLPAGYDPTGMIRYPVLYLLHGGAGDYQGWRVLGQVQRVVDAATQKYSLPPFIVVMPEGGSQGWYTDWYGTDLDGHTPDPPPAWETFHLRELIPWIDANYPTVAERSGRAIAGLSMGGFGAMSYAARHPDIFVAAGSFSGAVHTNWRYPVMNLAIGEVVTAGATGGPPHQCIWGDPITQQVRWREDDPTYIAENLDHLSLFVASGNGEPGPYDRGPNPVGISRSACGSKTRISIRH